MSIQHIITNYPTQRRVNVPIHCFGKHVSAKFPQIYILKWFFSAFQLNDILEEPILYDTRALVILFFLHASFSLNTKIPSLLSVCDGHPILRINSWI